jgi:arylsulfatase A-like enzyme
MVDGDFQKLLDGLDELGVRDDTIVVFAGDNGCDTCFHAPNNQGAHGNWRGGYFSTFEGNNRTVCMVQWPGRIPVGRSDEMVHAVDWFPTLMHLTGHADLVPRDRVLDGVDQSALLFREQENSNREHFFMFFDELHVSMRWRNFKVLTHVVESGTAPIQQLATPHIYNLTVNPDESTPYNYDQIHSWLLHKIYGPLSAEFRTSLDGDQVPKGPPTCRIQPPRTRDGKHPLR